jgi:hypothetical protein
VKARYKFSEAKIHGGVVIMMSKNYWSGCYAFLALSFVLFAIVLWAVWGESAKLTEQRLRSEVSIDLHIEYAEDRIDEKCLKLDPKPMRDCIHDEIESARDHSRANQDLNAQQEMARFTRVMGWTAMVGLLLAACSAGLIFYTLRATQDMSKTTREIGNRQTRAYCGVDSAEFVTGDVNSEGTRPLEADVIIKNFGSTPAYRAHGWVSCGSYSKSNGILSKAQKGQIRSRMPLGPNARFSLRTPISIPNEFKLDETEFFIFGYWRYEDCFGERRLVRFRYCVDEKRRILIPAEKGNFST